MTAARLTTDPTALTRPGNRIAGRPRTHSPGSLAAIKLFADPDIALQPIVSVATGRLVAVEALARFRANSDTESVFRATRATGRGPELEAICLAAALARRDELPSDVMLTVNVSPDALVRLCERGAWPADLAGVVVEITEHVATAGSDVAGALRDLRERGAAIAVDDAGSGYAGLLRLAEVRPDYVKIDRHIVSGVGDSAAQSAVLEALVTLSHRLGATVIAEGIEDLADLDVLAALDVDYAQGYAIAMPARDLEPVTEDVVRACRDSRSRLVRGVAPTGHAARTRDVYAVAATLANAGGTNDIGAAIATSALDLDVDFIGVSLLGNGMTLREVASTAPALDPTGYSLSDYPVTRAVVDGGDTIEIQLADVDHDLAERELMSRHGYASLLIVPVLDAGQAVGVVEFAHCRTRRWTAQDVAHAQGLTEHLVPVLERLRSDLAGMTGPTRRGI